MSNRPNSNKPVQTADVIGADHPTAARKSCAAHLAGATRGLPLPPTSIRRIPLHALQRFYISAGVAWYGLLDAMS